MTTVVKNVEKTRETTFGIVEQAGVLHPIESKAGVTIPRDAARNLDRCHGRAWMRPSRQLSAASI